MPKIWVWKYGISFGLRFRGWKGFWIGINREERFIGEPIKLLWWKWSFKYNRGIEAGIIGVWW